MLRTSHSPLPVSSETIHAAGFAVPSFGRDPHQLLVFGTNGPDQITLDAQGSGPNRAGFIFIGEDADDGSSKRDLITYRGVERVEITTFGGSDSVLSNDTDPDPMISPLAPPSMNPRPASS